MTFDQKQKIALFRYSVIAPLETGISDPSISNNEFFRRAAAKTYTDPDGKTVTIGASTIEKWHRAYKKGGFDALFPQSRKDEGVSRKLDQDLQSRILFLMEEHPRITAAEIHRTLLGSGDIHINQVSASTVERFVRLVRNREGSSVSKDMRRYERAHINEVWYGDTMYGPWLTDKEGKKRVYFIALIDDASRFIVAAELFFNDSFENLMTVIRSAVSKFGRPGLFTFDNGSRTLLNGNQLNTSSSKPLTLVLRRKRGETFFTDIIWGDETALNTHLAGSSEILSDHLKSLLSGENNTANNTISSVSDPENRNS